MLVGSGSRAQEAPDAVTTFKLPPAPTRTPQAQGPVVEGVTAPRRAPVPDAPEPPQDSAPVIPAEATVTEPAVPEPSSGNPADAAASSAAGPESDTSLSPADMAAGSATATPTPSSAGGEQANARPDSAAAPGFSTLPKSSTGSNPAIASRQDAPEAAPDWDWWPWALGIFCALWIGGGLFWLWRQRHETGGRIIAPTIERASPKTRDIEPEGETAEHGQAPEMPVPTLGGGAASSEAVRQPLRCTIEATRLSLTLMNVTLSYRITLSNETDRAIHGITVGSDMVTAHASLPVDQQLAGTGLRLEPQHRVALLLPDQNAQLSGELRLPIPAIHPLRRGDAVMFVPLLRLRIDGEGMEEMILQTLVIGQKPAGPGAGLRPFRLDLGPRIYGEIGHRLLAPQG